MFEHIILKPGYLPGWLSRAWPALFTLLISLSSLADVATAHEEYEIPEHGLLLLDVPTAWQVIFYQPADNGFPIISFFPFEGNETFDGSENFQLSVAVFWTYSPLRDLTAPKNLRRFVESVGQSVLKQSDQETLELEEIAGRSGMGYAFDLTDSDASNGEYQNLTQGAIAVGDLIVAFSLVTRDHHATLRALTLEMLKTARQEATRHDVFYTFGPEPAPVCHKPRAVLLPSCRSD